MCKLMLRSNSSKRERHSIPSRPVFTGGDGGHAVLAEPLDVDELPKDPGPDDAPLVLNLALDVLRDADAPALLGKLLLTGT